MTYIPKGGMCAVCANKKQNCSALDFSKMKKISKPDKNGIVIVKCDSFNRRVFIQDKPN